MAAFNHIVLDAECPNCHQPASLEAQTHMASDYDGDASGRFMNQRYPLGVRMKWFPPDHPDYAHGTRGATGKTKRRRLATRAARGVTTFSRWSSISGTSRRSRLARLPRRSRRRADTGEGKKETAEAAC